MFKNLPLPTPQKRLIVIASVVIPLVVAVLFKVKIEGVDFSFLPPVYAFINFLTSITLILAVKAAKQHHIESHQKWITVSLVLSISFLIMYVLYHMTSNPTPYGGEGILKYVYYFLLISHILLSVLVIPLVLLAYATGINRIIEHHKKIVRFAFPLWWYVAISGVLVYLLIAPYYS
jgi:putative membrane protein